MDLVHLHSEPAICISIPINGYRSRLHAYSKFNTIVMVKFTYHCGKFHDGWHVPNFMESNTQNVYFNTSMTCKCLYQNNY